MFTKWFKNQTIQNKILFSQIVLVIVPLSVVALLNYMQSSRVIEDKAVEQFYTISQLANQQLDQYIEEISKLADNITESPIISDRLRQGYVPYYKFTEKEIREENKVREFLIGMYKLKPGISSIRLYGDNGIQDYYHPELIWKTEMKVSEEEWYRKTREANGKWIISGIRQEKQFGTLFDKPSLHPEAVVTFSRLLKDRVTFKPVGMLAINLRIEQLESMFGAIDSNHQLLILDEHNKPIINSKEAVQTKGKAYLKVSTKSPLTGWTSVYMASKADLFKESKHIRNLIIGFTALLTLLALVLAQFLARGIVKPLRVLRVKMKELAKGDFNIAIPPESQDEVGELTQRFNKMTGRMKDLVEEVRAQEAKRAEVELAALQARINPHFMYNTLNGIRSVAMMEGNKHVGELISSFVYLLQFSSKNKESFITVLKELELLRYYVELMKMRNDEFDFVLDVDPRMTEYLVFPFMFQPLVENAIFHGLGPSKRRGELVIQLRTDGAMNTAAIRDNGIGMEPHILEGLLQPPVAGDGEDEELFEKIGMLNVQDRLRLQFGSQAELKVSSVKGSGTEVRVSWPVLTRERGHSDA
ncbi:hypothetical protein SY83_09980 [Paenibacillus swuensis]|uniref:HAMP domain-containing protein n=1 Tax=Paenibacillus swuensis TaxID=1178515 RepID=A0A172THN6_9BACL|nr:sensor histidine kinase [Paenibacillus swuensis]ANE46551.1 hypothetical protein SY83_09980 [Paenibacillus swuensis]